MAAGGHRADQRVLSATLGGQHGLVDHDAAADQMRFAAGLLVLIEEVDRIAAAEAEIDGIDVIGKRGDHRGEVFGAERHPEALGDLAAETAELQGQTEHLRVDERVILTDRRDRAVAFVVVDVLAETGLPLGAVHVEAEEVLRRVDVGGFLGTRASIDEGHVGLGLGIVANGDALGTRKRADDHIHLVLFHQLPCCTHGTVRAGVGRGDDHLQFLAAGHVVELFARNFEAANAVLAEYGIGALKRGHHADLDLVGGLGAG